MTINTKRDGNILTIAPVGRLDTITAHELGELLDEELAGTEHLTLDFEQLDYISSAGLRVLLKTQKAMNEKKGDMKLIHVKDVIMEVFEPTGFLAVLTIE